MTVGRSPIKTPDIIDVEAVLDHPRADTALTMARYDAKEEQQRILNDVLALGSDIGIVRLAGINKGINAVAEIKAFERIRKSQAFKHIAIPSPNGNSAVAENIDDFCRAVFGKGYKAMSNQKEMLDKLGEETYEQATRIGLSRAQLRLLINLPEDTRSAVEEAMQDGGTRADVEKLILSLANQLDEAKEQAEELKAEQVATEQVSSDKSKLIDKLRIDLERVKKLPPDEVLAGYQREATAMLNDTRGALIGKFSACVEAIDAHHAEHGGDSAVFLAGLVGQLQVDLNALRDRFGIPDVAPAMIPEWVNDPSFAALAKE